MGDTQPLPNGNVFIGWGSEPYFSEFSPSGKLLLEGELPGPDLTYRATLDQWTGLPLDPPAGAALSSGAAGTVYASWNGATQVVSWRVLAGPSPDKLTVVAGAARSGSRPPSPCPGATADMRCRQSVQGDACSGHPGCSPPSCTERRPRYSRRCRRTRSEVEHRDRRNRNAHARSAVPHPARGPSVPRRVGAVRLARGRRGPCAGHVREGARAPSAAAGEDDLAYLMRVLRNTFLTGRRTASRRPATVATLENVRASDTDPMGRPDEALEIREVYSAIAELPGARAHGAGGCGRARPLIFARRRTH